ncbi:MAG: GNAT family N-acetyltransferase [Candidatus Eremiobacteraeota bacterium]|nr:GNAT family N-acetyltransferase [Candidatus Eremiobacteraeota bacterium]MBV8433134.1 GNAT family N-acetyltransferase [Candidatus Eremiobacteraeota bacterium]
MSDVRIERASVDDVRALAARRRVDDFTMRLSLASADGGSAWIARDDGDAIGVALCDSTEEERYAGDVYVSPSFRGQRIGTRLVEAAFEDSGEATRAVVVDLADSSGIALALQFGLLHHEIVLRLAGSIPKEEELAAMAAGDYRFEVGPIDPLGHSFALNALDRETRGAARPESHRIWSVAATGQAFFNQGEFVGYAYVWPDGRIGPCAVASGAYARQIFAFSLLTLQRAHGASWCTFLAPASNLRVMRPALRAGLRIEESFAIARDARSELDRYVGFHKLAF